MDGKPEWKLERVNLLPFLSGEKTGAPHDALYWRFGEQMAIRAGDRKLVRYDGNAETHSGKHEPVTPAKLYKLASDLHGDKDLAAEMPDKVKELQAKWNEWNKLNIATAGKLAAGDSDGPEPGAPGKRRGKKKAQ